MKPFASILLRLTCAILAASAVRSRADAPSPVTLSTNAQVDGEGVFLSQIASAPTPLAHVLLVSAPAWGQAITLTRAQIQETLRRLAPGLSTTNWRGAEAVHVTRRARTLGETDLKELLTSTLQREYVKDRGELELRFMRAWVPVAVPDEPLNLSILELPLSGVGPLFMIRFELRTARESIGTWQASLQARVWKDVWVAQAPLRRGEPLRSAEITRERRDILNLREPLAEVVPGDASRELAESVPAGSPLLARVLKLRALVHRGQGAHAVVREGALEMTMKVEVLEDGVPGQIVRARNPDSKREIRGKVIDEQTILVAL